MPHPLDGPRARVAFAGHQIDGFRTNAQRFFQENGPRWRVEKNRKTGKCDFRVYDVPQVPQEFGIVVGQIAHNLAAALDGLACQLALAEAGPRGTIDDVCRRTEFPIYIDGPRGSSSGRFIPKNFRRRHPFLRRYVTAFEQLQPYRRGNGYRRNPLWLLREINNADKHRVVAAVAAKGSGVGLRPRFTTLRQEGNNLVWEMSGPARITAGRHLKEGTKIGDIECGAPEDVNVDVILTPAMAFGETNQTVRGMVIPTVLTVIRDHVGRIIEDFSPAFA